MVHGRPSSTQVTLFAWSVAGLALLAFTLYATGRLFGQSFPSSRIRMERIPTTPSDAQLKPEKARKGKPKRTKAGRSDTKHEMLKTPKRTAGKRSKAETQRLADAGESGEDDVV